MAEIGIKSQFLEKVLHPAGYRETLSVFGAIQDKVKIFDPSNKLNLKTNLQPN